MFNSELLGFLSQLEQMRVYLSIYCVIAFKTFKFWSRLKIKAEHVSRSLQRVFPGDKFKY